MAGTAREDQALSHPPPRPSLFVPPAVTHPDRQLAPLAFFRTLLRNPMETWPVDLFRKDRITLTMMRNAVEFIMDPALVEEVLVTKAEIFRKAPIIQRTIAPAVGEDSIFTAHGAQWRWQRRAAAPSFRNDRILSFVPIFAAAAEATVDRLLLHSHGGEVDLAEAMMQTTFAIIAETMLSGQNGLDIEAFGHRLTGYFETVPYIAALTVLRAPRWMPYPGRARARRDNAIMKADMIRIIQERRARNTIAPSAAPDLLDGLITAHDPEDGRAMTDEELADNLLTFVVAGHETTSIALTWTLWLVSRAPDVERQLLAEIEAVAGAGPITPDNADRLVYTRQVIQEAMRLFPPAPLIPRIATEDTTLGGLPVPGGRPVYIPVYAIHRHEALWTAPGAFDPDRFAPDRARAMPRGTYLPFGAGPRICIGASFAYVEAVVILATVVRRLKLSTRPDMSPKPVIRLTMRPDGGMPMRVERR